MRVSPGDGVKTRHCVECPESKQQSRPAFNADWHDQLHWQVGPDNIGQSVCMVLRALQDENCARWVSREGQGLSLTATIRAFVVSAFFSSLLDIFSSVRAVIVMLNSVSSIVSFFQKMPAILTCLSRTALQHHSGGRLQPAPLQAAAAGQQG